MTHLLLSSYHEQWKKFWTIPIRTRNKACYFHFLLLLKILLEVSVSSVTEEKGEVLQIRKKSKYYLQMMLFSIHKKIFKQCVRIQNQISI